MGRKQRGGSTARTNAQAGPTQPSVLRMWPELRCAPEQQRGWSSKGPAPRKGRRRGLLAGGTCLVQGGIHFSCSLMSLDERHCQEQGHQGFGVSGTAPRLEQIVGLLLRCLVSQHLPRVLPPPLPAAVWGGPRDGPDPRKGP